MLEPIYETLVLSKWPVTRTDVSRAIYTCGWEIGNIYTLKTDPIVKLLPDDFGGRLITNHKPKTGLEMFHIVSRVEGMIFIEPLNKSLSQCWIKPKMKKLIYHYHPELFSREQE